MANINPVLFMPQTDNVTDLKRQLQDAWGKMATALNGISQLYVQATMPTLPENTVCLWQDTTNTPNDYYLVGNFGTGTHKLVQLTDALGLVTSHKHSKLWASDGSPEALTVDATGGITMTAGSLGITRATGFNVELIRTETTGQPGFLNLTNSAGDDLTVEYTEQAVSNLPVDAWIFRAGGDAASHPIGFSSYDALPTLYVDVPNTRVGVGKVDPGYLLDMEASGGGYYSVADHAWHNGSSIRAKEEITTLPDALEVVKKLRGVSWKWKDNGIPGTGLVAEEVYSVVPEVCSVSKTEPGYCDGLAESRLIGYLVEAIKAQQIQIETQQAQIDSLKEKLEGDRP